MCTSRTRRSKPIGIPGGRHRLLDAALTVLNAADAATVRATPKDADGNTVWQTTGDAEAQTAIPSGPLQGIAP